MRRQDLLGAGLVGLLIEVLVHSGEFIVAVLAMLTSNVDLLLPLLSTLQNFIAPELAWLDAAAINQAVLVVALLYVGVILARLAQRLNND
jgi:hypothetical protein